MTREIYRAQLRDRLIADGCAVSEERLGERNSIVGYRSDLLVKGRDVEEFVQAVGSYAKAHEGARRRGRQSGVAALAVIVGTDVRVDAVSFTGRQGWGFAMNGHLRRKLKRYFHPES